MVSDKTGVINESVTSVLVGKIHTKIPPCSTLEAYDEMPIFIPVEIMEDLVESIAPKLLGILVPGGTDLEALQGWLLKFGEDRKKLFTSVEIFVDWIVN